VSAATRVLVTGAGGQVGVDLSDVLGGVVPPGGDGAFQPDGRPVAPDEFEVIALTHHDLDVGDAEAARRAVATAQPDVIVHLAAYTAVDRAEQEAEDCFRVNAGGTAALSDAAREFGAHLVALSTDYVFNGDKGDAYVETDQPDPLNVYGASKLAGERACRPEDTIVRTSWVMGVRGRTVVKVIAQRARSGETVRFVNDQRGTVTLAADLARALVAVVRDRPGGIWHVANRPSTTWFDLATFVGASLGRPDGFAFPITTPQLDPRPAARRPARSDLSTDKWSARGWRELPDWREGVERLLGALEEAP
jgi:dTDP-4-dehydrorhamnose reductase